MPYKPAPPDPADTVQIVYVGALPAVVVSACGVYCPRGVPVGIPASIARGLLEQATWKPAAKKPKPAADAADHEEKT